MQLIGTAATMGVGAAAGVATGSVGDKPMAKAVARQIREAVASQQWDAAPQTNCSREQGYVPLDNVLTGSPADDSRIFAQQAPKPVAGSPEWTSEIVRSMRPDNPWMATGGASSEHNDAYSSNVSPQSGPSNGPIRTTITPMGALCPTIVLDSQGYLFAYCVDTTNRSASLRMLAPDTLAVLASTEMPSSGRLGGFYMYMDAQDRIVFGAGDNHLLRISHNKDANGRWNCQTVNRWDLSGVIQRHCDAANCDYLESVMPDWSGRIWFSTEGGIVGTVDAETGAVRSTQLPPGEQVANSTSSSAGVAVVSDHALHLFRSAKDGTPIVQWREAYERGSKTKPGQLSHGTGATRSSSDAKGIRTLA
jgi:hypothetical protein